MFDPAQPSIAVAYVVDSQGRLLLTWNDKWGAFTLPMTKLQSDQPAVCLGLIRQTASRRIPTNFKIRRCIAA